MNEVKELVKELRNKKSRDNRDLLDRSADMIEKLAKELCEKSGCHHKCHDTKDCVVEDEAREYLPSTLTNEEKVSEKDKLLLINENKSNNFDVKSNEELFKQALVEGLNRCFDRDLQIAEMTETINELYGADAMYYGVDSYGIATALYNAGYRKQSEGEWIKINPNNSLIGEYYCSCCNSVIDIADGKETPLDREMYYCPNCGSKMKGGEE